MLTSDQLTVFLAVIRTGNTVAAAKRLGIDHSTVSRRLAGLEQEVATRLFDRSPRGLAPTTDALALVDHAERIERNLIAAAASLAGHDMDITGTVRLATPEIFGTYLVAPHISKLRELHPRLTLELAPESRSISLSRREADIAIMLARPTGGQLVARKLTDYRLGLFAGHDYLRERGPISTVSDIEEHPLISYIDELLDDRALNVLQQVRPDASTVFRSSSSSSAAQQAAVAAGAGLGMLHLLSAQQDQRLTRVLNEQIEARRSYWLVLHADLQRTPRIRAVVTFLDQLVQAARHDL